MKRKLKIEQIINQNLKIYFLDVKDVSKMHEGHSGYVKGVETHFEIKIISDDFKDMTRIERQRLVNNLLIGELNDSLHAISYSLLTINETKKN